MKKIRIGYDATLDAGENDVFVTACQGEVSIVGPFEGWMGFGVLADLDSEDEGDALANAIAANPAAELSRLGYDHDGWFVSE